MADYGFRLMSGGGRDLLDPASQRSAIEEFTRFRHRRAEAGEPGSSSRDARAAGDAIAGDAGAAALGMPPSATYGGVRPRGPSHSGFGPAEGDPWFSLRPSQPSRHPGMAMSMGRMGREALGRSNGLSRRCVRLWDWGVLFRVACGTDRSYGCSWVSLNQSMLINFRGSFACRSTADRCLSFILFYFMLWNREEIFYMRRSA